MTLPVGSRNRPIVIVFLAAIALVAALSYGAYHALTTRLVEHEQAGLFGFARHKAMQVETLVVDLHRNMRLLVSQPVLRKFVAAPTEREVQISVRKMVADTKRYLGYRRVLLFDANLQALIAEPSLTLSDEVRRALVAVQEKHTADLVDIHLAPDGAMVFGLAHPVFVDDNPAGAVVAILYAEVGGDQDLFPMLGQWLTRSPSGESLLARRDGDAVQYLSPLRHLPATAPLSVRRSLADKRILAAQALSGGDGLVAGTDYRGVEAVGGVFRIQGTPWVIVTKMDRIEVEGPARMVAVAVMLGSLLLLLLAAAVARLLWRGQEQAGLLRAMAVEAQYMQEVRRNEQSQRALLDNFPFLVWLKDAEGRFLAVNQRLAAAWHQASPQAVVGKTDLDFCPAELAERYRADDWAVLRSGVPLYREEPHPGDPELWIETYKSPVVVDGEIVGTVGFSRDISERRQAEEALRQSRQRFVTAFNSCPVAASITTLEEGRFIEVNANYERDFGWTRAELVGKTSPEFSLWPDVAMRTAWIAEIHRNGGRLIDYESPWRHKNGETRLVSISCEITEIDRIPCVLAYILDITERKKAEARIQSLAFYDQLTGLANRALLLDRLRLAQAFAVRNDSHGAVLFVDFDNFKDFNDARGHDAGDRLLREAAVRLQQCVRDEDTIARVGGDEFVIVLSGLGQDTKAAAGAAEAIAAKILSMLIRPYPIDETASVRCTASIGLTLFKAHEVAIDDLLKQADIAMHRAKEMGRNTTCFFDPNMEASVKARVDLEHDLRLAIDESQFVLHYQPQVLSDGRIVGAEALVRWRHPGRGMVSPGEFIPLAEQVGLIIPLGTWVLEAACRQLAAWSADAAFVDLTLAVNVSPRQFRQPDFVEQVAAVIRRTGANPQRLKLELTESLLVQGVDDVIEKMYRLKAKGIGFSLDDFGTGYSSLAYLKQLPLDQLKIDQSFVRDVLSDSNDAAIARTVVALAQSLGLSVIAEGVETEAQRDFLLDNGCHAYQGYYFSPPVSAEAFVQLARPA